jgi:hypothetical protein
MRKRSKYRPIARLENPIGWVIERMKPAISASEWLITLKLRNHGALLAMMDGTANLRHADDTIAAHAMCHVLASRGFGVEYKPVVDAAHHAIVSFCERHKRVGRYGLTGSEIAALRDLLELHDQQIGATTIGEVEDAIAAASALIKSGFYKGG